jgi:multiple sugar transport system substrate-binding protein
MANATQAATITRRAAVGALAAAGAGFALFGPRGAKEAVGNRLVLDYWEKWTGIEGRAMEAVVRDFNDSQDRLFVRYFSTAGIDEKAQISIAGGSPPDVIGLWNYNVPAFAAANAILPLDDLGAAFGVRLDNYAAGVRQVMTYGGRMWATVNTGGSLALYYNRAHFREAGLDPDRPPRTIADLDECNRQLTQREGGRPSARIVRMGFHHREPGWWPSIWGYQFGGSLYDEATDRSLAASPENVRAYEWVASYPEEFGLTDVNQFRSGFGNYDSPLNPFIAGTLSMVLQGPWLANMINLHRPDLDYGVAPFPVAEGLYDADAPLGLIDTDILVIPRGVRHPEASMEFVAYTQRQEIVERLSTVHCKGSPMAAVSEEFLASHPNKGVRVFNAICASPRAYRVPPTRCWSQIKDEFVAVLDQTWNLKAPPRELLARAQQRSQAVLDLAADQARRRARRSPGAGA